MKHVQNVEILKLITGRSRQELEMNRKQNSLNVKSANTSGGIIVKDFIMHSLNLNFVFIAHSFLSRFRR